MAIVFLAEKVKLSSSTVKTLQAANKQPSPCSTIRDQLHSETSNLEFFPTPSDDDLLSNLNWMHHTADEVHPQVNVIGTSSKPTITENSEDSDFSNAIMKTSLMKLSVLQCQVNHLRSISNAMLHLVLS